MTQQIDGRNIFDSYTIAQSQIELVSNDACVREDSG